MNFKDPFEIEKFRQTLAKQGRLKDLKKLYKGFPEIPDSNSSRFWDKKLSCRTEDEDDGMERDRALIVSKIIVKYGGRVLDVGFGRAELEKKLQNSSNVNLYGVDISSFAVEYAARDLQGAFMRGNILNIPFKNQLFDIVVALEVLEHIPPSKTFEALKEIRRVLKKKGLFIISAPLNEGLEEMIARGENPNAHLRVYTPELVEAELKLARFYPKKKIFLFAFKHMYLAKKILQKTLLKKRWKPNNLILVAEK